MQQERKMTMLQVAALDLIVIVVYLLFMLGVGVWFVRRVKNTDDYYVAGRTLGPMVLTATVCATIIGGSAMMGRAGVAYTTGFKAIATAIPYMLGMFIFSGYAGRIQRVGEVHGIESIPALFAYRFGTAPKCVLSAMVAFAMVGTVAAQVTATATIIKLLGSQIGISYEMGAFIATMIFIIYTAASGLFGVVYTDVVQFFMLVIFVYLMIPTASMIELGGEYRRNQTAPEIFFSLLLLGVHRDGLAQHLHIRPHGLQAFDELRKGDVLQGIEGVDLEPHQKGIRRRGVQSVTAQLAEGLLEKEEAGKEAAPLFLRPGVVRLKAQGGLELGKAAGLAEGEAVELRELIELQEFIVALDLRVLTVDGNEADHIAGDGGGAVAFQHADPFVALLYIKPAQVFVAADGIPDAFVSQMGRTQPHPLGGKFAVLREEGHKVCGKGALPSAGLGADDALRGDLDDAQVHPSGDHGVVQNLVQHLGIGVAPLEDAVPVILLPLL